MKKTLSGDNIVISHIELDNLIKPADDIHDSDNNLEDNYIYQTIYTQPLLLKQISGLFHGKTIIIFLLEEH